MHRDMGQPSEVEALLPPNLGPNQRLDRIAAAVDWDRLGQVVVRGLRCPGRPAQLSPVAAGQGVAVGAVV